MKIVIAGGGRVGRVLAARLVKERHTVTVIDRDREVCDRLFDEIGAVTVCGDGTDVRVLERAGLRAADVAAGLLARDADNLAFATLTRALSSARVMVRMLDDSYLDAYRIAGARDVIAEADVVVAKIATAIEFPQVTGSMPLGAGDAILFELVISARAKVAGRTVAEVRGLAGFPKDCVFIGLVDKDGAIELPAGGSVLKAGYIMILVAHRVEIARAVAALTELREGGAGATSEIAASLRHVDFFAPLSEQELSELLRSVALVHRAPGEAIYRRGEPGDAMYFVLKGEVDLMDEGGALAATLGPPEIFGETTLLTGEPRTSDAIAATACELVAIGRQAFAQVVMANPAAALEMSRLLGQRLAEAAEPQQTRGWRGLFRR